MKNDMKCCFWCVILPMLLATSVYSQGSVTSPEVALPAHLPVSFPGAKTGTGPDGQRSLTDYVLGPGDQLTLTVPDLDDAFNNKVFRIDGSGDITLPFAGRVHAA